MADADKTNKAARGVHRTASPISSENEAARRIAVSRSIVAKQAKATSQAFNVAQAIRTHEDRTRAPIDSLSRDSALILSTASAIAELQALAHFEVPSASFSVFQQMQDIAEQFRLRFEVPTSIVTRDLLTAYRQSPFTEMLRQDGFSPGEVE